MSSLFWSDENMLGEEGRGDKEVWKQEMAWLESNHMSGCPQMQHSGN